MKTAKGWAFPDADQFMSDQMKPDGGYQRTHLDAALGYVTDWSVAVDCGAHVGTWSRPMAARFARVIAVEPSQDTFEALTANMQMFGCANVELKHCALGDRVGTVDMAPLETRAEALKNTGARFVKEGTSIPLERIDDWQLPSCGFIKLDIEGSEPLALRGARETLTRCRPIVLYENKGLCRRFGETNDAPARFLASIGFQQVAVVGMDVIWRAR